MPKVLVIPGDGIGVEVTAVSIDLLNIVERKSGTKFEIEEGLFGGSSIDANGVPLTDEVKDKALDSDAVLLGAVGGPKWDGVDYDKWINDSKKQHREC